MNRLIISIAILCSGFVWGTAQAEQPRVAAGNPDSFAIQLPGVDREALVDLVKALRSRLILRKQELAQIVADSNLEGGDAILAAIMPGGLLYAGYKKVRFENATDELDRVNAAIEEYSSDILAMQSRLSTVAIAQLQ